MRCVWIRSPIDKTGSWCTASSECRCTHPPTPQVAEALDKLDGTGCQGVDGVHLLRTLATALPEWLTLAGKPGGGCMVVVKAQGVDHGALRGTLVRLAGPRRRLSMGAALRPVLLPNA